MEIAHLIAFNLALLAAIAAPGPAFLFAIKQAVSGGFWTGVATGAGLALVAAAWTAAALLGLDLVFRLLPWLYTGLKVVGALYLLWLAWNIWRHAQEPVGRDADPKRKAFIGGILVNLANPKSVFFAASVLVVIFPGSLSLIEKSLITINHFLVEVFFYTLISLLLATPRAKDAYLRLKPTFDRIAAVVLGALGLRLLFNR